MKGIPQDCILNNGRYSPEEIYTKLYNHETLRFDLAEAKTCMTNKMKGLEHFSFINLSSFIREISITTPHQLASDMYTIYDDEIEKINKIRAFRLKNLFKLFLK